MRRRAYRSLRRSARAIMLWRTHVDQTPDEANAMTAVALADVHAAAADRTRA
jgi:hypothetical protein